MPDSGKKINSSHLTKMLGMDTDMNMASLSQIFLRNVGIRLGGGCGVLFFWFRSFLVSNQMFSNNKQGTASFYVVSAEANFA